MLTQSHTLLTSRPFHAPGLRARLTLPAPHFDTLGPSPAAGLSAKKAGYLADAIIDALKVLPKPKL